MISRRADIFLGDALDLVHALELDGAALEDAVKLLGLRPQSAKTAAASQGADRPRSTRATFPSPATRRPPSPRAAPEPEPAAGPLELQLVARESGRPPAWFPFVSALPPEAPPLRADPKVPSLVPENSLRGVVTGSVATRGFDGEVDVARIIRGLSRGELLERLPRRPIATLRRGVQVLSDVSEGMLPYRHDVDRLVDIVRTVVGHSRTEVVTFAGSPLRGDAPRWRPPRAGTVVFALSTLGIAGPLFSHECAPIDEWVRFARRARAASCPVVAWVPFAEHRWPRALSRWMVLLPWSDLLTAGRVRHRVGQGHEVGT